MLTQIIQDHTLVGHSLTNLSYSIWNYSKAEISSKKKFCQFVEIIARRILAPTAALTAFPIGFTAKMVHHGLRSYSALFFSRASFASLALTSPMVITFNSPADLQQALMPHSVKEVEERIARSPIPLAFESSTEASNTATVIPLRHTQTGNLLQHRLIQLDHVSAYYPESPRVPHHLAIALNRLNVQGITDVSEEENQAIFACIRKIAEIYKKVHITGFVIAQYDNPQQGHLDRYVVEVIPHLPGFNHIKNLVDKVDCNRHVLFREANITPVICSVAQESIEESVQFWKQAFIRETETLSLEEITITFPHTRYESHEGDAQKVLRQHLAEILQDKGGKVAPALVSTEAPMPMEVPDSTKAIEVARCPFCDPIILKKQRVFEHDDVEVLYNIRKGAKPGCTFLVLPKRHNPKVYGLSEKEIDNISLVRRALVQVLRESHPENEVIIYLQDDPAIGQSVFHSHEQIVSVNPDTIALSWTLMILYPSGGVTDEEMALVKEEFGLKMQQKIKEMTDLEEAV